MGHRKLLPLLGLLLFCGIPSYSACSNTSYGGFTCIHSITVDAFASPETSNITGNFTISAGHLLVVYVRLGAAGSHVTSVTDIGLANTFSFATNSKTNNSQDSEIWFAANSVAVTNDNITDNFTSSSFDTLTVEEWSGVSTSSPFDVGANGTNSSGTTATSGSFTPAGAGELIIGGAGQSGGAGPWSAGAGFSLDTNSGGTANSQTEARSGASGAQTASITFAGASAFGMDLSVAAFKAAPSVPGSKVAGPSKIAGPTKTD